MQKKYNVGDTVWITRGGLAIKCKIVTIERDDQNGNSYWVDEPIGYGLSAEDFLNEPTPEATLDSFRESQCEMLECENAYPPKLKDVEWFDIEAKTIESIEKIKRVSVELKEYVLIVANVIHHPDESIFIVKKKPDWQKGRINFVGGKIEPGESPHEAARREFYEETGLSWTLPHHMGRLETHSGIVHVFSCYVPANQMLTSDSAERPFYRDAREIFALPAALPNLKVIWGLVQSGVDGWIIEDYTKSDKGNPHTVVVTLPY